MMIFKYLIFAIFIFAILFAGESCYAQQDDSLVIPYTVINSTPQNADVYVNTEYKGETPLRLILRDSSDNRILIKLNGYLDYSFNLPGSNTFQKKDIVLISKTGTIKKPDLVFENKDYSFYKPRKWPLIAISAIVTAGAGITAYYFKSLAIENNDDYYLTGNGDDITRKKKYDLISGISVGVLQLGLASMLYFLFGNN